MTKLGPHNILHIRSLLMRNLFQFLKCCTKDAGGRYLIITMSLFNDVIIDLLLQWNLHNPTPLGNGNYVGLFR